MSYETNPITRSVREITAKLATVDAAALERLEETATLDRGDWWRLGYTASRALACGTISTETAMSLHAIHSTFNTSATLAQRLVFITVAGELLARQ